MATFLSDQIKNKINLSIKFVRVRRGQLFGLLTRLLYDRWNLHLGSGRRKRDLSREAVLQRHRLGMWHSLVGKDKPVTYVIIKYCKYHLR